MHVVECNCVKELSAEALENLARRGNALIEGMSMRYPVACTLFDSSGDRLAVFNLGQKDADEKFCDDIERAWHRSSGGVTLLIQDAGDQSAELAIIIVSELESLTSK